MTSSSSPRTGNEVWTSRVAAGGDKLAFKYKAAGAWVDVSWRQVDAEVREVASGLMSLGVAPGDRVCVLAQTRYEWMLADVGGLLAGAAVVPIYPSSTPDQCAYIVADCGARVVIAEDAAQLEKVLPLLAGGRELEFVHVDGDAKLDKPDGKGRTEVRLADVLRGAPADKIRSLAALRAAGRAWLATAGNATELERRVRAPGPQDLFTIIYTSGTTGSPKGVVLTHENLASALASACRALTLREDDLQYLWLTLAHVLGREMLWAPIYAGAPTAFTEGLLKIKDNLAEIRPTLMAGVPRVYEKFYNGVQNGMRQGSFIKKALVRWAVGVGQRHSKELREGRPGLGWQHRLADKLVFSKLRAKLGLDRCRFLISGGAPLAAEIAEFFHAVGLLVLEGYGLTETMAAVFVNQIERFRFGTVGPAIDVVESRIAEDGEILLRGPSIFKQYYNNAPATAEAIDAEGWFHTGDIGHLEDGFLRITDRKKDLIVLGVGKKVPPQVIENAVKARSSLVSQIMVHGDKKAYCVALITASEDAVKTYGGGDPAKAAASPELVAALQQDLDRVNETLAPFEQIKRFAVVPEDFTEQNGQLTPSLKVKRKVVVERHAARIEALYG
jgi:long-chain acyl-CoA synthetase